MEVLKNREKRTVFRYRNQHQECFGIYSCLIKIPTFHQILECFTKKNNNFISLTCKPCMLMNSIENFLWHKSDAKYFRASNDSLEFLDFRRSIICKLSSKAFFSKTWLRNWKIKACIMVKLLIIAHFWLEIDGTVLQI